MKNNAKELSPPSDRRGEPLAKHVDLTLRSFCSSLRW